MSEAAEKAEEANDEVEQDGGLSKSEFFERLTLEGVTLDGDFYMPYGQGRQRRYYKYDPSEVDGFDAVRDGDEIEAQQVASHDRAMEEQVSKDHIEDVVFPKVRDGFGAFGHVQVESEKDEGQSGGDVVEYEPMDDDDVIETIVDNFDEHGFFTEDDDGEEKVVSLAHPDAKPMGYITGSHIKSLPAENMTSVDDYRTAVVHALPNDTLKEYGITTTGDVPIAPDDMMETFKEAGNSLSEEEREKLSKRVEQQWEDGVYDHLRKDEEDDESASADDEGDGASADDEDDEDESAPENDEGDEDSASADDEDGDDTEEPED